MAHIAGVSGAFIGALANNQLRGISFDRGFVGVNGIKDTSMMTANLEEGQTQGLGLNRSRKSMLWLIITRLTAMTL